MDEKDKIIQDLKLIIIKLMARIEELEKRLGLNSKNSSKPPSSDGFKKLPPSSLRQKGKNPIGGQKGHVGYTLKQINSPGKIVRHELTNCPHCQNQLSKDVIGITKRQVFDIPPIKMEVTEHQAEIKICSYCKKEIRAEFPIGINVPAQYGPRIKAQAVYLGVQHFIPEDRLQVIFQDLYGAKIATATLVKFSNDLAGNLGGFCQRVLKKIKLIPLKHMDETGFGIGGKTAWLHVASNKNLTYYDSYTIQLFHLPTTKQNKICE